MEDAHLQFRYSSWEGAVYDPVSQGFNLFDNVVYSKGAWVLHTLRGVVGDSLFFRILRDYRAKHSGGNATTEDFQAVVDSITVLRGLVLPTVGYGKGWRFTRQLHGRGQPIVTLRRSNRWAGPSLRCR
jgi:hypothetical protein